jgi:hypothetical protein
MVRTSELLAIPGVGESIARDLEELGIRTVAQLKGRSPEGLYEALCERRGHQDRCLLYVFRCAVYYAERKRHDPERLKWWNWKDAPPARRARALAH